MPGEVQRASASSKIHFPDWFNYRVERETLSPCALLEIRQFSWDRTGQYRFENPCSSLTLLLKRRNNQAQARFTNQTGWRDLGEMVYVPAGQSLDVRWKPGSEYALGCSFDIAAFLDQENLRWDERLLAQALDLDSPWARQGLIRLARELENPGLASDILIESLCTTILVDLHRQLAGPSTDAAYKISRDVVAGICERIAAHPEQPVTLGQLAQEHNISVRHLSRLFARATGCSLPSYVAAHRAERAKRLLRETDLPLKQIAHVCGFSSAAAFSTAFSRSVGISAGNYRKPGRIDRRRKSVPSIQSGEFK